MSDNDQMTDSPDLRELRNSLSCAAVPGRPRLESITARGRARRRHRLSAITGLSLAGAAAGTALVLGLTGVLGPASTRGTIRTAAFMIVSNPNGTDTLTINPNELFNATALQNDLAQYGIPAKVTAGSFCSSDPAPSGFSQVVSIQPAGEATVQVQSGESASITIDPTAMPAGAELSFGNFQLAGGAEQAYMALINTNSYTCSSTPPASSPSDGEMVQYGGHTGP